MMGTTGGRASDADSAPAGLVFRDASAVWWLGDVRARVRQMVQGLPVRPSPRELIDVFLWASAYEAASADCGCADARAGELTDELARALEGDETSLARAQAHAGLLAEANLSCTVRRPEGFSYYALWPCDVMATARRLPVPAGPVVVVGIRTTGTAMSALVRVVLEAQGHPVRRLTVRPIGHPYDRRVEEDGQAVREVLADRAATFVVVDEGPGLSGSSFLSSAEWLTGLGVPATNILLLGTRVPDPDALLSPQGAARWRCYRSLHIERSSLPGEDLSGGAWRRLLAAGEWPASWVGMERLKCLLPASSGRPARVAKFEGLGSFGAEAWMRAHQLWEAGFGPRPGPPDDRGMVAYPLLQGRRPGPGLVGRWLDRLARYCWFRRRSFPAGAADGAQLQCATTYNVAQELGTEWKGDLPVLAPIVVDGRMQPWEWVQSDRGAGPLLKLDATSHGDDHFLPGPTDVAWDLAGAVVEWSMRDDTRDEFLRLYACLSGDRDLGRVAAYEIAYAAFRAAYCGMASHASGPDEEARLRAARERYRRAGRRAFLRQ